MVDQYREIVENTNRTRINNVSIQFGQFFFCCISKKAAFIKLVLDCGVHHVKILEIYTVVSAIFCLRLGFPVQFMRWILIILG